MENERKGIKLKQRTVIAVSLILGVLVITSVTGALLEYFGQVDITIEAKQSVLIDGHNWDEPVVGDLGELYGGCCECTRHTIINNGCEGIWLDWEHFGEPDISGIDVTMRDCFADDRKLESLEIRVLDGQAPDSFIVKLDGVNVYGYPAQGGEEIWVDHVIDLTQLSVEFSACGDHVIRIRCMEGEPWEHHETYGQLAVDTISLYSTGHVLCGTVDIGNETSEAGHNLEGWGPVEPTTHGGNWGGFDISGENCRVTWEAGLPIEEQGANVTISCPCVDVMCDCEKPIIDTPFYLEEGTSMNFCLCYELDMMIEEGSYVVSSQLIQAEI